MSLRTWRSRSTVPFADASGVSTGVWDGELVEGKDYQLDNGKTTGPLKNRSEERGISDTNPWWSEKLHAWFYADGHNGVGGGDIIGRA